jgi:hypothetical protein
VRLQRSTCGSSPPPAPRHRPAATAEQIGRHLMSAPGITPSDNALWGRALLPCLP